MKLYIQQFHCAPTIIVSPLRLPAGPLERATALVLAMPRDPHSETLRPGVSGPKVQRGIRSYMFQGSDSSSTSPLKRAATADDAEVPPAKRASAAGEEPAGKRDDVAKPSLPKAKSTGTPAGQLVDTSVKGKAAPGNPRGVVSQLIDALHGDNLLVMFVGVNPGIRTAETGHAYAHPSNHYWRLLHASGLTPRQCKPSETHDMVSWLRYGNTNLVARATKDASTLTRTELDAGVADIEGKARQVRAHAVCLVGKGIWDAVERVWRARGRRVAPFKYGFRPESERMGKDPAADWPGSRVFVATTTSALAVNMSWEQKLEIWKELGTWVAEERKREADTADGDDGGKDEDGVDEAT